LLNQNNQNETKVQWNLSAICGTNSATNICKTDRKGVVSDNAGMPIPGVVKGTEICTQTDFDGKYVINASPSQILLFSYIGMLSQS
jgi:hypothetical protein